MRENKRRLRTKTKIGTNYELAILLFILIEGNSQEKNVGNFLLKLLRKNHPAKTYEDIEKCIGKHQKANKQHATRLLLMLLLM